MGEMVKLGADELLEMTSVFTSARVGVKAKKSAIVGLQQALIYSHELSEYQRTLIEGRINSIKDSIDE